MGKPFSLVVAPPRPISSLPPIEESHIVWCPNCKHGLSVLVGRWSRCECGTEHFVDA